MSQVVTLALRGLQAMLALTNLGLASYGKSTWAAWRPCPRLSHDTPVRLTYPAVTNWYVSGSRRWSPSSINWLVFVPIFSVLSIVYLELAPRRFPRFSHPFASLSVEFLNTLFYFSGFIAFAVFLSQLSFCNGPVCSAGRAVAAVAAFEFAAWSATTILLAKDIFKGGFRSSTKATSMPMRQV
ncbi:hypothetical protein HJFPF1_00444 [Paramyrothecium foliicola]|nr:hypothetical protein HJFPF1_00444 [Paramyrothecium foliicola]